MNPLRETVIVAREETRRSVTSARLIVCVALLALFCGLVLLVSVGISSQMRQGLEAQMASQGDVPPEALANLKQQALQPFYATLFGSLDPTFIESLIPLPVPGVVLLKLTWMFLPMFIGILGFDAISAETNNRSLRYLLIRARRPSILLGKWLSLLAVLGVMLLIAVPLITGALRLATGTEYSVLRLLLMELRFGAVTWIFALPYAALTLLCSSLTRSSPVSLVFNLIALFGMWLVALIGNAAAASESALGYLRFLSPWHFSSGLIHPEPKTLLMSIGMHLLFAAVGLAATIAVVSREDL